MQQGGGHTNYYMILKIFLIDVLHSVISYIDIMQQLCIWNGFNLLHISQNNDCWGNVRNSGGNVRNSLEIEHGLGNLRVEYLCIDYVWGYME